MLVSLMCLLSCLWKGWVQTLASLPRSPLHPSSLPFTKILFGLPLSSQRGLGKLSTGSDYRVQTKPDHANECFCVLPDLRWSQETLFAWPQEQLKGSKMELP